jgi:hypothetical protein
MNYNHDEYYSVVEIAEIFNVTKSGVRYWLKNGLRHRIRKELRRRPMIVIKPVDVEDFLMVGLRDEEGDDAS